MKRLALLLALMPAFAFAGGITGVDDREPNIPDDTQALLDDAFLTYYQAPSVEKVNTVLDILSSSRVLEKKTAWAPMVGFLTVIFADNKDHVMSWISRNDYNDYAISVIVDSLMNAHLEESALVFAQAEQWKEEDLKQLREAKTVPDLKHLKIIVPGHIDTLWGAFFAYGDPVYLNEIIDVLFMAKANYSPRMPVAPGADVLGENKTLAKTTLKRYAVRHEAVRKAIKNRMAAEKIKDRKKTLEALLPRMTSIPKGFNPTK